MNTYIGNPLTRKTERGLALNGKTIGTLMVQHLKVPYDSHRSKVLGSHIAALTQSKNWSLHKDFFMVEIPNPVPKDGEPAVISVRVYRPHTWNDIINEIERVKTFLR